MRVLHIGKYFPPRPGGMESFLGDLSVVQVRHGSEVAVLVHGAESGVRQHGDVVLYEARAGTEFNYAPVSPGFVRMLGRAVREFRPEVIHVHVPNLSALWLLLVPAARRVPWVIQWQSDIDVQGGPLRLRLPYQVYRVPESALLRRAAAIICSSPDYLDSSRPLRPWRDKARVIPLGIDPDRIAAGNAPPGPEGPWAGDDALRVLVVGRLAHYKGHRFLLQALRRVDGVRVAIAGSGELDRPLRRLAERLGVADRVTFLGHAGTASLNALLHACDLVCLPSTARTESFGLVLLEAMAAARPVIASNVPGSGMPWIVRTAGHGLLAEPGDAASLARALETMKDASLRERLGAAGRRALKEQFHVARVAERIDLLYRELLEARAA